MSDMRTPLARVRGLGSAKSGTEHFWLQRVTAIANIPLMLGFIWLALTLMNKNYYEAVAMLQSPLIALFLMLMVISLVIHMRLGMQVIIEDYIHSEGTKMLALMGNTFFSIIVALGAIFAILKISFGV